MNALRGPPLLALSAGVLLAHLWLVAEVLPDSFGLGAQPNPLKRIDVAFVRELVQSTPPSVAPKPAPPRRRLPKPAAVAAAASAPGAVPAEPAASAPVVAEAASAPVAEAPVPAAAASQPAAEASPPVAQASAASTPELGTPTPIAAALPASAAAQAFEWPPSTRLSYTLTGNYRGPVEGSARVEWLLAGTRYQVFVDASVGGGVFSRRLSSEGEITEQGLSPRLYLEETKLLLREPRLVKVALEAERVLLANGNVVPRPAGVQDSASQFVQLTWLFTTRPELLQPGRSIELPLALPRRVEPWTYDVLAAETLYTPAGAVNTLHVKPRREARPGGDLTAEFWVAPSLQYLPVRVVIRQDAETYIDLLIERLPQQALRGR